MTPRRIRPSRPVDRWAPHPDSGNDRPTPERMAHGQFDLIGGQEAGSRVPFDRAASLLDRAVLAGKLTAVQRDAVQRFAGLRRRCGWRIGQRDSLDMSPRGYSGDGATVELIDAERRLAEVHAWLRPLPGAWSVLVDVAEERTSFRRRSARDPRWVLFVRAVDVLVEQWGMGEKK